ncbi:MAG: aldehyde ferredoxin oxidoreductase N-terminal domain-containing protein, partial [Anaerolineales bacterium]
MSRYHYRVLHFDLSEGREERWDLPADEVRLFIGGASLGARLLYDRVNPEADPLAPEAPMLWSTGPLTGTTGPSVGRFTICARSPLTGIWGESNIGGYVGPELRFAGVDALLLTGRAEKPSYLLIDNGQVELRPAGHLWGQTDTYSTQERIKEEVGNKTLRVATIGKAGEQQIPFALILSDHGRVAGRTGMGAIMGSKNLKAVAVAGDQPLPIHDPEGFAQLRGKINRALR